MKKVIAINGSPRRNGNTAELLQQCELENLGNLNENWQSSVLR